MGLDAVENWAGGILLVAVGLEVDIVGTGWGEGRNVPAEVVGVLLVLEGVVLGVVLVVERGAVPVDVDVHVFDFDLVSNDTEEVELDLASLHNWVWLAGGLRVVECEGVGVIIALGESNLSELEVVVNSNEGSGVVEHLLDDRWLSTHLGDGLRGEEVNLVSLGASESS